MSPHVGARSGGAGHWEVWVAPVWAARRLEVLLGRSQALAPRVTEALRLSRRSRRRAPRTALQYPGYIFLAPSAEHLVDQSRWRARPLLVGGTRATVRPDALRHALLLEERSASSPLRGSGAMFAIGDMVVLVSGPLVPAPGQALPGTVVAVRGQSVRVHLSASLFPVVCDARDLEHGE